MRCAVTWRSSDRWCRGAAHASKRMAIAHDPESGLPAEATATLQVLVGTWAQLEAQIAGLETRIARCAKESDVARRQMTVPGIEPLIATAMAPLAAPPETFRKARDFAAWRGRVPRQHSTGGKQRLGASNDWGPRPG